MEPVFDWIEAKDAGVYAHFDYQVDRYPAIKGLLITAHHVSGYVGISILFALVISLFLLQRKYRPALVAALGFALAFGLIELLRFLVPRRRPEKAMEIVGAANMTGSYPCANALLFIAAMTLLGFALWSPARSSWLRSLIFFIATALSVWVCFSQIYLRTHYLTDVLGGIAGAALIGWIASWFLTERAESRIGPD